MLDRRRGYRRAAGSLRWIDAAENVHIARGGETEDGDGDADAGVHTTHAVKQMKPGHRAGVLVSAAQGSGEHARGDGHRPDRDDGCQDVQRQQEFGHFATLSGGRTGVPVAIVTGFNGKTSHRDLRL